MLKKFLFRGLPFNGGQDVCCDRPSGTPSIFRAIPWVPLRFTPGYCLPVPPGLSNRTHEF